MRELEKAKEYLDYLEDIDLRDSGIPYSYYYAVLVTCVSVTASVGMSVHVSHLLSLIIWLSCDSV